VPPKKTSSDKGDPTNQDHQDRSNKPSDVEGSQIIDPYAEREAENYADPIPSREYILDYLRERERPATRSVLIRALGLDGNDDKKEALRRRLRAMERDGQLIFTRKGGYGLVEKMGLLSGRVIGHKDGFGFVVADDGGKDVFLNTKQMRSIFDGDRVLVRVAYTDAKGRREGELVEILERGNENFVGRYFIEDNSAFVVPENKRINQDIIVPESLSMDATHGQFVMVEILSPPTSRSQAIGRITEIIGEYMAPGMEIDVAIRGYNLPHKWPEELIQQAEQFGSVVTETDIIGRKDLREKPFVTIDGEDAKDFDDAVYCEPKPKGGWLLYVAIADVSHYVKPKTPLDQEAIERGNSVYFPGRVVPMLPFQLSNELCSLKPKKDRLTLVCEMSVSAQGKMMRYRFYEAVIYSHARMTYTNVNKILVKQDQKLRKQYHTLVPHLEHLYDLFTVLQQQRQVRGALEFDTIETKIIFGKAGKIEKIVPRERNDAHKLIEECMLLANVCASKFLAKNKIPTLYRVHEGPNEQKLENVHSFLGELGLSLKGGDDPKPKDYSELLESVEDRPDAQLIQTVLLRSMTQAIYTPENKGHFGLAFDCYAHFTSPIRRYPDLLVHRAIRHLVQKQEGTTFRYSHSDMMKNGERCSMTERRADDATRDVMDWLKCEYMVDRVGNSYEGIITGVTSFGLFVQLQDVFVEGLVHISELKNDYYEFDPKKHRLVGQRTGTSYRLADKMRVTVARVDLDGRQIDFVLETALDQRDS